VKIKNLVAAIACGCALAVSPSISHAEYITAFEDIKYEKYVVDTSSLFFPDKDHKMKQFNVAVWYYTSETEKKPYVFSYKFENNTWKLGEKDNKDGKIYYEKFDDNSPAANILATVLPYINKK